MNNIKDEKNINLSDKDILEITKQIFRKKVIKGLWANT